MNNQASPQLPPRQSLILVPPQDITTMADAVEDLIYQPHLRQHLSEAAFTLSQQFNWPAIAQKATEVYRTLMVY